MRTVLSGNILEAVVLSLRYGDDSDRKSSVPLKRLGILDKRGQGIGAISSCRCTTYKFGPGVGRIVSVFQPSMPIKVGDGLTCELECRSNRDQW